MVLLLLNPPLQKSSKFFVMPMISTTTLLLPTNGLSLIVLVHTSIVVEIMVSDIVRNPVTRPKLCRTGLSFTRRGVVNQVIVTVTENVLMVAAIIKAKETMKGTNLEWQTLPVLVLVEFIVLMEFGWFIVANVIPGVALPMPTPLISMMLPSWLGPITSSQTPIHSITIIPPILTALELQLLFYHSFSARGGNYHQ